jgi:hypothetical protein
MHQDSGLATRARILRNYLRGRIDQYVIYKKERWIFYAAIISAFIFRMIWTEGYFAICYLYGFFILQNLVLFLTPSGLPSIQDEDENQDTIYDIPENVTLEKNEDSSKPVIRKLGEFNLWSAH